REDVSRHGRLLPVPATGTTAAHRHGDFPRLPTHEHGIHSPPVLGHRVLHVAAEVEPVQGAVVRGDEAVEAAGCSIGDHAHVRPPIGLANSWRWRYTKWPFRLILYVHLETVKSHEPTTPQGE